MDGVLSSSELLAQEFEDYFLRKNNRTNLFKELIVHKSCSSLNVKQSLLDKCIQACNCISFWKHTKQVCYQEVTSFMLYMIMISIPELLYIHRKALSMEKGESEDLKFYCLFWIPTKQPGLNHVFCVILLKLCSLFQFILSQILVHKQY